EIFMHGIQSNSNTAEIDCKDMPFEDFSKQFKKLTPTNLKALLRTKKDYRGVYDLHTCYQNDDSMSNNNQILNRSLFNLKALINRKYDGKNRDIIRDSVMFESIVYLKNKYPSEKMILFGSSSHFIKSPKAINSKFMQNSGWTSLGKRLSNEFHDDYFFIAYTGVSGNTRGFHGKKQKLKKLIPNSIENTVNEKYNAVTEIMYLSVNRDKSILDEAVYSRFLGNTFFEIDITETVDGLFFIRNNNMD